MNFSRFFGALALCLVVTAPPAFAQTASPLQWEIERNFRYFLYPSDVATQRVARDILTERRIMRPHPGGDGENC